MRMISVKNIYLSIYNSQLIKCELYHTKNSAMNVISKTLSEMHLKCSMEHRPLLRFSRENMPPTPLKTALAQILWGRGFFVSKGAFLGLAPRTKISAGAHV